MAVLLSPMGRWPICVQRRDANRRTLVKLRLSAILCLLLASAGCAPQPDVTATDHDNGGHILLRTGQLFDVVLADDYDNTGCQWRDEHGRDDAVVHLLGQRYEPGRKPPNGDGNNINTERYRALQTGATWVRLVESDNAGKVCRRYAIEVLIAQPSFADDVASGAEKAVCYVVPLVAGGLPLGLVLLVVSRLPSRR